MTPAHLPYKYLAIATWQGGAGGNQGAQGPGGPEGTRGAGGNQGVGGNQGGRREPGGPEGTRRPGLKRIFEIALKSVHFNKSVTRISFLSKCCHFL